MKNTLVLTALFLCCLSFHGCMVASILGADYHVRVNNRTNEQIKVVASGDLMGDAGLFNLNARSIDSGDSEEFIIDGFEVDPVMKVEYHGLSKSYEVNAIWTGFEVIDVEMTDFMTANG